MNRPENLKVGDRFLVVNADKGGAYRNGDIVELVEDDGTEYPFFSLNGKRYCIYFHELAPIQGSLDYPYEGMVVVDRYGDEHTVLGVAGRAILLSAPDNPGVYWNGYTKEQLKERGYTVKGAHQDEAVEMTVAEVSKALGKTVKIVKEEK